MQKRQLDCITHGEGEEDPDKSKPQKSSSANVKKWKELIELRGSISLIILLVFIMLSLASCAPQKTAYDVCVDDVITFCQSNCRQGGSCITNKGCALTASDLCDGVRYGDPAPNEQQMITGIMTRSRIEAGV